MSTDLVTKCRTPRFIASYAQWLFKAQKNDDGQDKYSCALVFPKGTDLNEMKQCAKNAIANRYGADKVDTYLNDRNFKWPFRDGNTRDDEIYKDAIFLNASSDNKPGLAELKDNILERDVGPMDIYSGCYAVATVNFYVFKRKGNHGVGCGLNNLVKVADGTRLGGAAPLEEDFADFAAANAAAAPPSASDDDDPLK